MLCSLLLPEAHKVQNKINDSPILSSVSFVVCLVSDINLFVNILVYDARGFSNLIFLDSRHNIPLSSTQSFSLYPLICDVTFNIYILFLCIFWVLFLCSHTPLFWFVVQHSFGHLSLQYMLLFAKV